ncbi:hypothetical protein PR202_gb27493 [Eleusine coracana subsp. coracana]|uniref:Uncharacterized protein n=1 Tax=Eleusine coracana subsp. coracana TaxID=191504 RepID=A0AAV5FS06_ELECO|nr:hypothetical protein QOZ80_4BG0358530 [Eleusine coracana subsp. coracana]GJN38454.1 hypothetical protein PR202_gb27493 [Eleusine coracana subsp. coracana]
MSSLVTKSLPYLVSPSEPTPSGTLEVTAMDAALASLPMAGLFMFDRPIDQAAETIRRALARALVPYYPIAGRLASTSPSGLAISCTGQGVAFVAATASCTLHDARLTDPRPPMPVEELTVTYAGGQYTNKGPAGRPLLLMQVTKFSCGGFVVGVTWDHVIADGIGMAQFLQIVGELARGVSSSPSVVPVRQDNRLPDLPLPIVFIANSFVSNAHNDNEFPRTYITLPMSYINRIKSEFHHRHRSSSHQGEEDEAITCSAFEVFAAALWKCRARATIVSAADHQQEDSSVVALAFAANVRKQADAKDGYYGNLFTFGLAVATRREVADGDILDLVKMVKDAKARLRHTFMDGAAYVAGEMQGVSPYDTFCVTSWWNLGFDDVDFGSGGPARVMANMERRVVPMCILCGSNRDRVVDGGVAAVAMCVREEHKEAFHAELQRLHHQ